MNTTYDAEDFVWHFVGASELKALITGGIYKRKRPMNSKLEDLVVSGITMVNLDLQEGFLSVNIHVPNLLIDTPSGQDNTLPNHARLKQLTNVASSILKEVWSEDGQIHFEIQSQTVFEEQETNSHFTNIRLSFYSVNI